MKLTAAQRKALVMIAADICASVDSRTTRKLRSLGLIDFGEGPSPRTGIVLHGYVLTDAGREAMVAS